MDKLIRSIPAPLTTADIAPAREAVERDPENYVKQGEALQDKADILLMSDWYVAQGRYRDNMLLVLGVNLGLRVVDLLSLKFAHFINDDLSWRQSFTLTEKKTSKFNTKYVNPAMAAAIRLFLHNTDGVRLDDYLFQSNQSRGKSKPITTRTAENILKEAADATGISKRLHISTHTMRRTFAYHMWHELGGDAYALTMVQKMLNHSSVIQTMTYIGVTDREIAQATLDVNLCDRSMLGDNGPENIARETVNVADGGESAPLRGESPQDGNLLTA